jgi:hypothetical protein
MRATDTKFVNFSGSVWRIIWANQPKQVLSAARVPEGRFHRSGQKALYAALIAHGAGVALG